ncbi:hypothetical protein [Streptomyces angustmyceticus]|uniref:hypothetical protein n=1 Tax=Streptomyces angustmyceticus TaxID=285578 RepID=UPI00344D548B
MDSELALIASTASTSLIQLAVTDSWNSAKVSLIRLWERIYPDRASVVATDLEDTQREIAGSSGDSRRTLEEGARMEWQARIGRLLTSHPEVAEEIQAIFVEFESILSTEGTPGSIALNATSSGSSRIYQLGQGTQRNG